MEHRRFNTKGFVSLLTTVSFIFLGATGLVLYIVPQGRIAYWITWRFAGLTKTDWTNIHILFAALFLVAGIVHLVLNWKVFWAYIVGKARGGLNLKLEMLLAALIAAVFLASALAPLPPLSYLIDLSEAAKTAWVTDRNFEPPFGHAEELSLTVFCRKMFIGLDAALAELERGGIEVEDPGKSLQEIADGNGTTPMGVYLLVKELESPPAPPEGALLTTEKIQELLAGRGLGRRTLSEVCSMLGMDTDEARRRLAARGVEPGSADESIKAIADRHGTRPIEIVKKLADPQ